MQEQVQERKRIYKDSHLPFFKPTTTKEYSDLNEYIGSLRKDKRISEWGETVRWYAANDLFYLLNYILTDGATIHSQTGELFHMHQTFIDACRQTEWQIESGSGLDCSGRGGAKSTIRSKAAVIQLILNYPDIGITIFSIEKQLAKKHLKKIRDELQVNAVLKALFPEVLWQDPYKEAKELGVSWSLDEGLCVKRSMVRGNQTIEIHSMFGGGPVGTRPDVIIADDIESSEMVTSADNIEKLKRAFSEGVSLVTPVVIPHSVILISNTRFSQSGLIQQKYDEYLAIDPMKVRSVPAEDLSIPGEGPLGGTAIYPFTNNMLYMRYEEQAIKQEYALQFALDYRAANETGLDQKKLNWYETAPSIQAEECTVYICIDASRGVHDPTCMWVWGLDCKKNRYWLDAVVKRMDPTKQEFHNELERLLGRWKNHAQRVVEIRVDQMGNQAWADLIEGELRSRGYWDVRVVRCTAPGKRIGLMGSGKADRIYQRWAPALNAGTVYFPKSNNGHAIPGTLSDGSKVDLVRHFLDNEMQFFPRSRHDDMLDAACLLDDEKANMETPLQYGVQDFSRRKRRKLMRQRTDVTWMSV